jgi:hypothetical protein
MAQNVEECLRWIIEDVLDENSNSQSNSFVNTDSDNDKIVDCAQLYNVITSSVSSQLAQTTMPHIRTTFLISFSGLLWSVKNYNSEKHPTCIVRLVPTAPAL